MSWVFTALKDLGGKAKLIDVADHIWENQKDKIIQSRTMRLRWQYDMRWAATNLRKRGIMKENARHEPWELTPEGKARDQL